MNLFMGLFMDLSEVDRLLEVKVDHKLGSHSIKHLSFSFC